MLRLRIHYALYHYSFYIILPTKYYIIAYILVQYQ
nr:MAG TPA: hypothetical protein [Inoviridae sp.]